MAGHTAGPWVVRPRKLMDIQGGVHPVTDAEGFPSAFVPAWDSPAPGEVDGRDEALANACLIAAAPDLLKVVADVEWSGESEKDEGGYEPGCPWCGNAKRHGHMQTCGLSQALLKASPTAPERAGHGQEQDRNRKADDRG